jgi:hypothetical protein
MRSGLNGEGKPRNPYLAWEAPGSANSALYAGEPTQRVAAQGPGATTPGPSSSPYSPKYLEKLSDKSLEEARVAYLMTLKATKWRFFVSFSHS